MTVVSKPYDLRQETQNSTLHAVRKEKSPGVSAGAFPQHINSLEEFLCVMFNKSHCE